MKQFVLSQKWGAWDKNGGSVPPPSWPQPKTTTARWDTTWHIHDNTRKRHSVLNYLKRCNGIAAGLREHGVSHAHDSTSRHQTQMQHDCGRWFYMKMLRAGAITLQVCESATLRAASHVYNITVQLALLSFVSVILLHLTQTDKLITYYSGLSLSRQQIPDFSRQKCRQCVEQMHMY